ncbi:MAG: replicase [Bramycfau virus 4]|nr:MAG: replicase [Bramycfau virus 4]
MKKFGYASVLLLTERITSAVSTFEWYIQHPLQGIGKYQMHAGGVKKQFTRGSAPGELHSMTTGAFVQGGCRVPRNAIVLLDEAHNLSADTAIVIEKVPAKQLVLMSATPANQGVPVNIRTPYPATVKLEWFTNQDVIRSLEDGKGSLHICPTVKQAFEEAAYYRAKSAARVFCVTREKKVELVGRKMVDIKLTDLLLMRGRFVVVSTDVLQESVTLHISDVFDEGTRCRPELDAVTRLSRLQFVNDEHVMHSALSLRVSPEPLTVAEFGQVVGRVGRIKGYAATAHIKIATSGFTAPTFHFDITRLKGRGTNKVDDAWLSKRKSCFLLNDTRKSTLNWERIKLDYGSITRGVYMSLGEYDEWTRTLLKPLVIADDESVEFVMQPSTLPEDFLAAKRADNFRFFVPEVEIAVESKRRRAMRSAQMAFMDKQVQKRRGTRAGKKHAMAKKLRQPGACALRAIKFSKRSLYEERISKGVTMALFKDIPREHLRVRGAALVLNHVTYHVQEVDRWPTVEQISWMIANNVEGVVAGDERYAEMLMIADEIAELHDYYAIDDSSIEEVPEPVMEEVDREVRGPGDCWKRLWFTKGVCEGDHVTASEIISAFEADSKRAIRTGGSTNFARTGNARVSYFVLHSVDEDGDFHVGAYIEITGKFEERKPARSQLKKMDIVREQSGEPGDWVHVLDWIDILKESPKKLVASSTSAYDTAIAQFRVPEVQRTNEAYLSGQLAYAAKQIKEECPFAIKPENRKYANDYHINFSLSIGLEHPHPIHNALRRRQIKNVLPKYVNGPVTVVSMQKDNVMWLQEGMESIDKVHHITMANPICEMRDLGRYLSADEGMQREVFNLDPIETSHAIFHDCGHFLDEGFLLQLFVTNPALRVVITTSVFPMESLFIGKSSRPSLYEWIDDGTGTMVYIPEGDRGNCYHQPMDAGLLLTNNIVSRGGTFRLKGAIVDAVMNCYVQVWSPYEFYVPNSVPIEFDGIMPIPRVFSQMPKDLSPVPRDLYADLIKYGRNLPSNMKPQDAWGKIRTQSLQDYPQVPVGDLEWLVKVVMLITKSVCTYDASSKLISSFPEEVYYHTMGKLIRLQQRAFGRRYAEAKRKLINEPKHFGLVPLTTRIVAVKPNMKTYGVQWEIPKDGHPWWLRIKPWLAKFVGKVNEDVNMSIGNDNIIRWESDMGVVGKLFSLKFSVTPTFKTDDRHIPELGTLVGYTKVNINRFGLDNVKIEHIRDFRRMMLCEGEPDEEDDSSADESNASGQYTELTSHEDSSITTEEDPEPPDAPSEATESVLTDDSPRHCPDCPTFVEWDVAGMSTYSEYYSAMLSCHLEKETKRGRRRYWIQEIAKNIHRRQEIAAKSNYVPMADNRSESQTIFDTMVPVRKKLGSMVKSTLGSIEELPEEVVVKGIVERGRKVVEKNPWDYDIEEARTQWEKLKKSKPELNYDLGRYTSVGRWDKIFPTSQDKRLKNVPYRFIHYPMSDYPKQPCLLNAVAYLLRKTPAEVYSVINRAWPEGEASLQVDMLPLIALHAVGCGFSCKILVINKGKITERFGIDSKIILELSYRDEHLIPLAVRGGMVIDKPLKVDSPMPKVAERFLNQVRELPGAIESTYVPNRERAAAYAREMLDGGTGTFAEAPVNLDTIKGWEELCGKADTSPRSIFFFEGEAGCGKSFGLTNLLKNKLYHQDRVFNVSLPTTTLADDWRAKLGVRETNKLTGKTTPYHYVTTFERTLASGCWGWFMIWDEDKFPKGYMDLVMFLFPHVRHFAFCCDRYQSEWHEPNSKCRLNDPTIPGNAALMAASNKVYIRGTMRFGPGIANFQRMITFNNHKGGFHFTSVMPKQWADLSTFFPQFSEDQLRALWKDTEFFYAAHVNVHWAEQLAAQDAVTFAGSQGLTAELAVVEIDARVIKMSIYRLLHTVLNRARNYIIVSNYVEDGVLNRHLDANLILRELMWYKDGYVEGKPVAIVPEHSYHIEEVLQQPLPDDVRTVVIRPPDKCANREFMERFPKYCSALDDYLGNNRAGKLTFEGFYEDKHTFKSRIIEFQDYDIQEPDQPGAILRLSNPTTHLPPSNLETLKEMHRSNVPTRFAAELSWKNFYSEQKPDLPMFRKDSQAILQRFARKNRMRLGALIKSLPKRHEKGFEERIDVFKPDMLNLGLDQKSSDHPSFAAGLAQRVRYGTYLENMQEIQDEAPYGIALYHAFCHCAGWDPNQVYFLQQVEVERCKAKFNQRRSERSEALKMMSLNRSEPDYADFLSAKTQWKMKEPEMRKAKGLQPIFVRGDEYLFRMGWIGVLLLDRIQEELPPHIYIHAQKSMSEAKAWFEHFTTDFAYHEMLDMSGLDGTVRGGAINMMKMFMIRYGVPQEDIDYYINDKADFHTRTRHIALMTLSGEIFTYLINTLFCMSREMLKYNLPYGFPIAGTGDDIDRKAGVPVSPNWRLVERFDYCVEKRFESKVGEFASFKISKGKLYKDPVILLGRLLGQLERGKVDEISLGYFELFSNAYILRDQLFDIMDENELEHQDAINRIMFNLKAFGAHTPLPWHKLMMLDVGDTSAFDVGGKAEKLSAVITSEHKDEGINDVLASSVAELGRYTRDVLSYDLYQ